MHAPLPALPRSSGQLRASHRIGRTTGDVAEERERLAAEVRRFACAVADEPQLTQCLDVEHAQSLPAFEGWFGVVTTL